MGISITISAELEEKLSRRAAAKGLPLDEYVREVLERDAAMPTLRELFATVREDIQEKGTTDEELTSEIEGALSEVRGPL